MHAFRQTRGRRFNYVVCTYCYYIFNYELARGCLPRTKTRGAFSVNSSYG